MMQKRLKHEIILDEVLATLLKQYRHWIIFCVFGLIIALLYLPPTNLKKQEYKVNAQEIENVNTYIKSLKLLEEVKSYNQNSILMMINPYEQPNLNLEISITGENIPSEKWRECLNLMHNDVVFNELKNTFPLISEAKYLEEIGTCVDISNSDKESERILQVKFIYPDKEKLNQISIIFINRVKNILDEPTYDIQLLQNDVFTTVNNDLMSWQQTQKNKKQSCESEVNKLWDGLSEHEQLLFEQSIDNELLEKITIPNNKKVKEYFECYLSTVIISLLVFILYELIRLSWSNKVQNSYTIKNELSLNVLFEIKNAKKNNFLDRFVNKIISKITGNNEQLLMAEALQEKLVNYCCELRNTAILPLGNSLNKKMHFTFQQNESSKEKIMLLSYKSNMSLKGIDNLILIVHYNETYYKSILDLKEKCHTDKINLLGVVFFQ